MKRTLTLVIPVVLLVASLAYGMFAMPVEAPVDRLIANCTAYIKEHPQDARGYYTLGRVHYLALWFGRDAVGTYPAHGKQGGQLPILPKDSFQEWLRRQASQSPALQAKELVEHLDLALTNLHKAIVLAPEQAMYHLCLASILEQGAASWRGLDQTSGLPAGEALPSAQSVSAARAETLRWMAQCRTAKGEGLAQARKRLGELGAPAVVVAFQQARQDKAGPDPAAAQVVLDYWHRRAITAYGRAMDLAAKRDLVLAHRPIAGLRDLVSYEAAQGIVRVASASGLEPEYAELTAQARKLSKELGRKPMGAITPIVFSFRPHRDLEDLLAPGQVVQFDLDGTRRPQRWMWVRPDTAILVWDPLGRGRVVSGWQLFGSVTFFMFWDNGYQALDALDDNRDGQLTGSELNGLAAWFDRNGNGRCDPGETIPLVELGVTALSARATSQDGRSPMNPLGLKLRDGMVLPTYDWLATPPTPRMN